ncbi:MAG: hypothetical protein H6605_03805 [Flavobacteriales bacterium]|nr:hypothetical protein [Flavobacteriales bacterium]
MYILVKRLILFSASLIGLSNASFSQKVFDKAKVMVGPPIEKFDYYWSNHYCKDEKIVGLFFKKSTITIVSSSAKDLKPISKKVTIKLPSGTSFISSEKIKNKYFVFYSRWNRKKVLDELFCRQIDFNHGTLFDEEILLISTSGKLVHKEYSSKFEMTFSYDSSKILFKYQVQPKYTNDSKNYALNGLFVFDSNLKLSWGEEVEMLHTEKKMYDTKFAVDKYGNAYIYSVILKTNDRKLKLDKENDPNYFIEIIRIPSGSANITKNTMVIANLYPKEEYIHNMTITEGPGDDMICSGTYNFNQSEDLEISPFISNGIALLRVSKSSNKIYSDYYEFDPSLLAKDKFERKGKLKGQKNWIHGMIVFPVKFDKSGNTIILAEQQTWHMIGVGEQSTRIRYYGDIFVYNVSDNGELNWFKPIPKTQTNHYLSFKHMYNELKGYHYFVYSINPVTIRMYNKEMEIIKDVDQNGGNVLVLYGIDDEGDTFTYPIFQVEESKQSKLKSFYPQSIFYNNINTFMLTSLDGKDNRVLVNIVLKK